MTWRQIRDILNAASDCVLDSDADVSCEPIDRPPEDGFRYMGEIDEINPVGDPQHAITLVACFVGEPNGEVSGQRGRTQKRRFHRNTTQTRPNKMTSKPMNKNPKSERLTKCEARAKAFGLDLISCNGGSICIEWRRSRDWGYNPVILHQGSKCTSISGCGYDKKSAALAQVLCWLFPHKSEDWLKVACTSGCGWTTARDVLHACGWILTHDVDQPNTDVFSVTKMTVAS